MYSKQLPKSYSITPMYVTREELAHAITEYHKTQIISPELGKMLLLITQGACSKYYNGNEREEQIANCLLLLIKKLCLVRPDGNAFSYITQIIRNKIRYDYLRESINKKNFHEYVKEKGCPS